MACSIHVREHENSVGIEGSEAPMSGGKIGFHFDDAYMNRDELVFVYEGDEVASFNTWPDSPNKLTLSGLGRGYMSVSLDPLDKDKLIEATQEWVGEEIWDNYYAD